MKTCLLLLLGFLASHSASAWREVGHFSICELAYQNLTPTAKTQIDRILGGKSFAEQCTWPDMVRKSKEWKHTYDWHFVNVEDHQDYLDPQVVNPQGDVISAILKNMNELENSTLPDNKRKSALLFLGHFIGDVHQVVHIGRKSDLGGNKLYANWFEDSHFEDIEHLRVEGQDCLGPYYIDEPTGECVKVDERQSKVNLHKIWDLLMIDKFIEERKISSQKKYPYQEYLREIHKVSAKEAQQWKSSYVLDWAQESLCYRSRLYQMEDLDLGHSYYKKHIGTLNKRILMGGYRLSHTLNRLLDPAVAKENSSLRRKEKDLLRSIKLAIKGDKIQHRLSMQECAVGIYPSL